jgi:hypothetical protein
VGNNLTLSGGVTDLGTTSVIVASGAGTFINSGSLVANGNITLNSGSIVQNAATMSAGATFTIAGATVTSNHSSTPPFTCNTTTGLPVLSGATVSITGGTITMDSSACGALATPGIVGTTLQSSTNPLAISGGTINVTNEATISATGAGATGGLLSGVGVTVSGGTVNLTNTGIISGDANDVGVFLYSNTLANGNPMTFSGGVVTATNNGSVTMGVGALVQSGRLSVANNPINVSGGTLTVENTFNLTSTTAATGASLGGGTLTVSAGALNLENTGDLTSFPGQGTNGTIAGNITVSGGSMTLSNGNALSPNTSGSLSGTGTLGGVEVTATGNFIQTGGSFTNENAGTIAVGTGSFTNIAGTTSLSTGGTFTNLNSGNVTAPSAIGSYFESGGNLGLGAGITVNLSNSGTITAGYPGSIGSFIKALTITDSGSTVNITNSGSVSGYATIPGGFPGTIGAFLWSSESTILTGGTWTATNTGAIPAGGQGIQIECDTNFTLGGNASITLINDVTANVSTLTSIGCLFEVFNTLNFPSGSTSSLSLINNQAMTTGKVGAQAIAQLGSTMAGGTLNITNTNTIGPSTGFSGAVYLISAGAFIQTGGTVNMNNSGAISSTTSLGDGVGLKVSGSPGMSLTGGNFNMINSGAINSASEPVIGAIATNSGPLVIGGTAIVTVTNSGPVSSPTVAGVGCELSGFGTTVNGGTLNLINNGTISGVFSNVGTYFNNSSTGPMIFSGGIFTGTNNSASVGASSGVKVISGPPGVSTAPIVVDGGTVTLTNAGTLSNTSSSAGTYVQGSSLTVSAGSLTLSNTGNLTSLASPATNGIFSSVTITGGSTTLLNAGTISGTGSLTGVQLLSNGVFSQTGGTFTNSNTQTNSSGTGVGSLTEVVGATLLSGGTLTNTNSGSVTVGNGGTLGEAIGSYFWGLSGLTLSGGSMTLSNSGTISASGSAATGSFMYMPSITSSGSGSTVSLTNTGIVENFSGNIGTYLLSAGAINHGGGTWLATNTGTVTTGTGVLIQGATLNISGASANLTLQNNQALASGTGVQATVTTGTTMSAGTFNVINTANLSGSATGAALLADVSFNQTGGTFTVSNSGTNSGSGNASYIQSPAITISGSGTFNNPNALVAATTVTVSAGGTLQSGTPTVPGVFEDLSFGTTTVVTNNGGTFVSGTLDPTPGQTTISGVFTQNAGTYAVVIGNLSLPSNQGISFLTVNGTGPADGVVNLDGGILNIVPATGFNLATDIPAGTHMVQFIQASTIINGGFSPQKIVNSIPGLGGLSYETLAGNQGWLLFTFVPPPPPVPITPPHTPIPYQPITITTINMINTFLGRELLRMQDDFIAIDEKYQYENGDQELKKHRRRRPNTSFFASLANLSMPQSPKGAQTLADPILAADPQLAFMQYNPLQNKQEQRATEIKQEQLASEISSASNIKPWNMYFGPLGNIGSIHDKHSQLGAHYRSAGALAGFDYRFSQVGLGLLVDYENVKAKLHQHGGEFWINQFHATGYTTYVPKSFPQFALNGIIGAGGAWYDIHRNILGLSEPTKAKSRGAEVDALIGADYLFSHCQFASIPRGLEVVPMINLQYIYQGVGSYKEHGAGVLDLKFHKQGFQSLRSTLGTWLQYIWNWRNFSFTPLIDLAWQREYLDRNHKVLTTPLAGGPEGSITVFGAGRDTLVAGLDLLFEFYNTYGIEASYDFEYNSLYLNHGFYVGFNARF